MHVDRQTASEEINADAVILRVQSYVGENNLTTSGRQDKRIRIEYFDMLNVCGSQSDSAAAAAGDHRTARRWRGVTVFGCNYNRVAAGVELNRAKINGGGQGCLCRLASVGACEQAGKQANRAKRSQALHFLFPLSLLQVVDGKA